MPPEDREFATQHLIELHLGLNFSSGAKEHLQSAIIKMRDLQMSLGQRELQMRLKQSTGHRPGRPARAKVKAQKQPDEDAERRSSAAAAALLEEEEADKAASQHRLERARQKKMKKAAPSHDEGRDIAATANKNALKPFPLMYKLHVWCILEAAQAVEFLSGHLLCIAGQSALRTSILFECT